MLDEKKVNREQFPFKPQLREINRQACYVYYGNFHGENEKEELILF